MADYNLGTARGLIVLDSTGAKKGAAESNAAMDSIANKSQSVGRSITRVGTIAVGAGTAIAAGLGLAIKASVDFNGAMQQIVGLVGLSQKQVDQWKDKVLELSSAYGVLPVDAANALFFITSAGFTGAAAMDVLTTSVKATAAGLGDTMTIAGAVTSAVNAYGQANLTASQAADILTGIIKEGKTAAADVAPVLGRIIPVASEVGVKFSDVGAAIASMTRVGLNAEQASDRVTGILRAFIKPSSEAEKALAGVGLSAAGLRKELAEKGLFATLMHLKTAFHGNIEELGTMFQDTTALQGVLAITGKNADANSLIFDHLTNSTGLLDKAMESAASQSGFKFKQAMASLKVALIEIGDVLAPIAAKVAEWVTKLLKAFRKLDPEKKKFIAIALAILAGALIIGGAVFIVLGFLLRLKAGLKEARIALRLLNTELLANPYVLLALAILALIGAIYLLYTNWKKVTKFLSDHKWIVALVAAFMPMFALFATFVFLSVWLAKNWRKVWNEVRSIGLSVWNWLKQAATDTVDWIVTAFNDVVTFFKELPGKILAALIALPGQLATFAGQALTFMVNGFFFGLGVVIGFFIRLPFLILDALVNLTVMLFNFAADALVFLFDGFMASLPIILQFFLDLPGMLIDAASAILGLLLQLGIDALTFLFNGVVAAVPKVITFFEELPGRILNAVISIVTGLFNLGVSALTSLFNGIDSQTSHLLSDLANLAQDILDAFLDVPSKLFNTGIAIFQGLWNGLKSLAGKITDWVGNFVSDMIDSITDPLDILSPSKVFFGIGENVMLGLQRGLASGSGGVLDQMAAIASSMTTPLSVTATGNINEATRTSPSSPQAVAAAANANGDRFTYINNAKEIAPKQVVDEYYWQKLTRVGARV